MALAIPEARLIQGEVTLRDLSLTQDVRMTRKSLVRWIALAAGLISPNESRKTLIDLLEVLFAFQLGEGRDPDIHDIMDGMRKLNDRHQEKAVRYHLFQLKRKGFLSRVRGKYFFTIPPFSEKDDVAASFEHVLKSRSEVALAKLREALRSLKGLYG
ncbi:MAG: hypothetical protein QXH27_04005 [Candidatus Micrarchaeia archaeon]